MHYGLENLCYNVTVLHCLSLVDFLKKKNESLSSDICIYSFLIPSLGSFFLFDSRKFWHVTLSQKCVNFNVCIYKKKE